MSSNLRRTLYLLQQQPEFSPAAVCTTHRCTTLCAPRSPATSGDGHSPRSAVAQWSFQKLSFFNFTSEANFDIALVFGNCYVMARTYISMSAFLSALHYIIGNGTFGVVQCVI